MACSPAGNTPCRHRWSTWRKARRCRRRSLLPPRLLRRRRGIINKNLLRTLHQRPRLCIHSLPPYPLLFNLCLHLCLYLRLRLHPRLRLRHRDHRSLGLRQRPGLRQRSDVRLPLLLVEPSISVAADTVEVGSEHPPIGWWWGGG